MFPRTPSGPRALRSARSRSTAPRMRTPLRLTTHRRHRHRSAFHLLCRPVARARLSACDRQRRRNAPPAPHAPVGERSFGHDCYRPAVLLLIISIAGLSLAGALLCGVIGVALVSTAFAGCAIARMVGHNQNRYAMAAVGGVAAGASRDFPSSATSSAAWPLSLCSATLSRSSGATPTSSPNKPPTRQDSPPPSRNHHKRARHLCGGAKVT